MEENILAAYYLKTLKEKAVKHTEEMEMDFKNEIKSSVNATKIYGGDDGNIPKMCEKGRCEGVIVLDKLDSVKSVIKHHEGKTAVLNFASYKNPGGKFFEGSSAQEENLCHSSNLYNVLRQFPEYYEWNKKHNNRALYKDRALYTKDVIFLDDSVCVYGADPVQVKVDVITCAAPNYSAAGKYAMVSFEENEEALAKRIKFVLDVAEDNGVETLILGAFGAGVFGQDALTVAKYFKRCLNTYNYHFKNVYFSIIDRSNSENYNKFKMIFKETVKSK